MGRSVRHLSAVLVVASALAMSSPAEARLFGNLFKKKPAPTREEARRAMKALSTDGPSRKALKTLFRYDKRFKEIYRDGLRSRGIGKHREARALHLGAATISAAAAITSAGFISALNGAWTLHTARQYLKADNKIGEIKANARKDVMKHARRTLR